MSSLYLIMGQKNSIPKKVENLKIISFNTSPKSQVLCDLCRISYSDVELKDTIKIHYMCMQCIYDEIKGDVNQITGDVNKIKGNVNQITGDVNKIKGEFT
jgi:uncharacterized protein YjbJ (UPF0337 family)